MGVRGVGLMATFERNLWLLVAATSQLWTPLVHFPTLIH